MNNMRVKHTSRWLVAMLFGAMILGAGCSSKKHFEPKLISGEMTFDGQLQSEIITSSREGAVLKDKRVLSYESGQSSLVLDEGYKFLAQNKDRYIVQKGCADILILEDNQATQAHQALDTIPFEQCVLSAAVSGSKLALVLLDNTLVYYDIAQKREIFSQKYPSAVAINAALASPKITQEYVIFPSLEGKVLIYSIAQNKIIKDILVSSDKFFNNIIYLYTHGDYLLAATAKRVSAVIGDKSFKYDVDVRDVLFKDDRVFVLSSDGEIAELDHTLKLLRKQRLPFAVLSGIVIHDNTLYTLEKGGFVIALSLEDFAPLVYKSNLKKKKSLFYNHNTFFYDKVYKRFE